MAGFAGSGCSNVVTGFSYSCNAVMATGTTASNASVIEFGTLKAAGVFMAAFTGCVG